MKKNEETLVKAKNDAFLNCLLKDRFSFVLLQSTFGRFKQQRRCSSTSAAGPDPDPVPVGSGVFGSAGSLVHKKSLYFSVSHHIILSKIPIGKYYYFIRS